MKIESPYISGEHSIKFEFVEARKDCNHLLVIFTSIRSQMNWLDFSNSGGLLKGNRSNILWIFDDIENQYSYYSMIRGERSVENAVANLVEEIRTDLGVPRENCTAAGMSKGGSAAIIIGVKCDFANIVALVPQFAIGSYLLDRKKFDIIQHMTGSASEQSAKELDLLVPSILNQDISNGRNFYLITSPYDTFCIDYLSPMLARLRRYDNFNLVSSSSDLAKNHIQTLKFNVPLILSLMGLLSENIAPRLGEVSNGSGYTGTSARDRHVLQASRFGGELESATSFRDMFWKNGDDSSVTPRIRILESQLEALRSSKLGRLQLKVWHIRKKFLRSPSRLR